MMPSAKEPKRIKDLNALSFGYTSAVGFFICVGLGYWADQRFAGHGTWTLVGVLSGVALIAVEIWKLVQNSSNSNQIKK